MESNEPFKPCPDFADCQIHDREAIDLRFCGGILACLVKSGKRFALAPLGSRSLKGFMFIAVLSLSLTATRAAVPQFRSWAPTPPMGWNSWDCFATTVTEAQTKVQADFMAAKLKAHGWQYIVVDIQWYEPGARSHEYRTNAVLVMDDYGRLLPAVNRFPSATNGVGFKPLADYVHSLGLKFGIHLMRGIPRQAVEKDLPIKGTIYHAQDIANRNDKCPWNPDMFGVDMSKPGAQDYYNSVFDLIASWGVDYVKVDDLSRPYFEHQKEIEAIRTAIDQTGHPMVLSCSPGATVLEAAAHVQQHANLWRISDDFWDRWFALREQFPRLERWNPYRLPGAWPDADMIPFGTLDMGQRQTRFTHDEEVILMTLWSIARSPLMYGGDLTKTDDATLALLTNDEVLAVNQHSTNNRPLFNRDEIVAWTADVPGSSDKYLAVFNIRDRDRLKAANARYVSGVVTRNPATAADIDADVTGGANLFLVIEPTTDDSSGNIAIWTSPRLVMADGTERSLTEIKWTNTDAPWDSTTVKRDRSGKPVGIMLSAQGGSFVEFELPAGAVRFKAKGVIENPNGPDASLRFFVVVPKTENETKETSLPITVRLADLGLTNSAAVRDLWTHQDLGKISGEFTAQIPFHGAGLYRLTPGN
jgi:alpha-galactosidase